MPFGRSSRLCASKVVRDKMPQPIRRGLSERRSLILAMLPPPAARLPEAIRQIASYLDNYIGTASAAANASLLRPEVRYRQRRRRSCGRHWAACRDLGHSTNSGESWHLARLVLNHLGGVALSLLVALQPPFSTEGHLSLGVSRRGVRIRQQHKIEPEVRGAIRRVSRGDQRPRHVLEAGVEKWCGVDWTTRAPAERRFVLGMRADQRQGFAIVGHYLRPNTINRTQSVALGVVSAMRDAVHVDRNKRLVFWSDHFCFSVFPEFLGLDVESSAYT